MLLLVEGRGVVKRYGDLEAVRGVDFAVHQGECLGFLGPNGAGKTSVLKMIQRISPLSGGQIIVGGFLAGEHDREIRAILGVAPQEESLDDDLNVRQNLEIYARYFGIKKNNAAKRTAELLQFFHLQEKGSASVRALSGGMRRRLVIARALVNDPKLLILDEPTTGLDPHARRVIWEKLLSLKRSGVTLLLTTHYMEEAKILCDRIALMDRGLIVDTGTPETLLNDHIGRQVIEFDAPDDMATVGRALDESKIRYETLDGRFALYPDADNHIEPVLSSLGITRYSRRAATLEDLFYKITSHSVDGGN